MERDGAAGARSAEWTSRYGSLVVTGYDISTADGMNEAGLVANLLWEVAATYPEDDRETPRIRSLLVRYGTVAEAVEDRESPALAAGGRGGPAGRRGGLRLSTSRFPMRPETAP